MTPDENLNQAEQEFNAALSKLILFFVKLAFWYFIVPAGIGLIFMYTILDGRNDPVMAPVWVWWIIRLSYDIRRMQRK